MTAKLILPIEARVCATCGYWDGDRRVDADMRLVVIEASCLGECLAEERAKPGLRGAREEHGCIWEALGPDDNAADTHAHLSGPA